MLIRNSFIRLNKTQHTSPLRKSRFTSLRTTRYYSVEDNIKQYEEKMKSHYAALGVDLDATPEEIQNAYQTMVQGKMVDTLAEEELIQFNRAKEAFEVSLFSLS
eukprot:TRINITY_DN1373_c0_g1_i1.p1 TRINITY_DN1373_c0_g1~~TRINITY_DN1373_c0_g1_i1.p1  ORF type:complete len:104 (-),score=26.14 TRINITY_DN1373_c0_g1_i1:680-991(-)